VGFVRRLDSHICLISQTPLFLAKKKLNSTLWQQHNSHYRQQQFLIKLLFIYLGVIVVVTSVKVRKNTLLEKEEGLKLVTQGVTSSERSNGVE